MEGNIKAKKQNSDNKYIEPFVTPHKIRVVSSWKQKLLKIFLVILYAAIVGMSISYLKDFVTDNGGLYAKTSILLFLSSSVVLGVVTVIVGGLFIQFLSRASSTISINTFIKHLVNVLSSLMVIIFMKMDIFGKDPEVFIEIYICHVWGGSLELNSFFNYWIYWKEKISFRS